jgi:hypothetical protein
MKIFTLAVVGVWFIASRSTIVEGCNFDPGSANSVI